MTEASIGRPVRLLLDINETLIRTGQVLFEDRLLELRQLEEFRTQCATIADRCGRLEIVFVTGNSYEYSRRVEEPLGLKNLVSTEVIIVSENGLLARSLSKGDMWALAPTPDYDKARVDLIAKAADEPKLGGRFVTQGNESRLTLKPVANTFHSDQIDILARLGHRHSEVWRVLVHEYYVDFDPISVQEAGTTSPFLGKRSAVERILQATPGDWIQIAVGDSVSDIPMFEAVVAARGRCFWVNNSRCAAQFPAAHVLHGSFTQGVCEALRHVTAQSHEG